MAREDMRLGLRPPSRRLVLFGFRRLRVARHNGINGLVSGRVVQAVLSKSEADHQYDVAVHPSDLTNAGCMERSTILLYLLLAPFFSRCRHSLLAGGQIMGGGYRSFPTRCHPQALLRLLESVRRLQAGLQSFLSM